MKRGIIADQVHKILRKLRIESLADVGREPKYFGRIDSAVLKVGMMIAALDGHVTETELAMFERQAKKCRGYNAASSRKVFREGLRSAGYLELAARTLRSRELLAVFVDEASAIIPEAFISGSAQDIRRVFVSWMSMCLSDNEYSPIERQAMARLAKIVTGQIGERRKSNEGLQALSPAFAMAYREKVEKTGDVVDDAFFVKAEAIIAKLNRANVPDVASAELKELIIKG